LGGWPLLVALAGGGTSPGSIGIADFNRDRKLDFVTCNYASNNLTLFLYNGPGTFRAGVNYASRRIVTPLGIVARDPTKDRDPAVVLTGYGSANFDVLVNDQMSPPVPPGGPQAAQTINPLSALPTVTGPVTIDDNTHGCSSART
jgi:hypothetical protein